LTVGVCVGLTVTVCTGVGVCVGFTVGVCTGVGVCVGFTVGVCVGLTVGVVVVLELHPAMAAAVTATTAAIS